MDMDFSESKEADKANIILCSRCGAEMKRDARYCMKCGNLNYDHPENASMRPYIRDGSNNQVKSNAFSQNISRYIEHVPLKNTTICLIVNIIIHFIILVSTTSIFKNFILFLGCFVLFLFNYSMQVIYIKANKPWWSYFVPFYNFYIFCEITLDNGWFFLLYFVPFVNLIVSFFSLYRLGIRFGRSGLFTLFLPVIAVPMIALSKDTASLSVQDFSTKEVSNDGRTKAEINYRRKQFVLSLFVTIGFFVLVYFSLPYIKDIYNDFIEFLNTKES